MARDTKKPSHEPGDEESARREFAALVKAVAQEPVPESLLRAAKELQDAIRKTADRD